MVGKVIVGMLAFAAGAVVGGLVVKRYVETHPGELVLGGIGARIFGEGSRGERITGAVGAIVDGIGNG